jgi:hypothetical protein
MSSSTMTSAVPPAVGLDRPQTRLARAADAFSYLVLAGGAATIAVAIYVAILGHSKLPFWDGWMQIDFAANEGPGHTLDWLWRQFNQHRVLVPKLFLLADLRWFHATQTSLIVSNLCLQLLHWSLLAWSLRVLGGWRGALWRTAVGLLAFCLFCPSQWPNFVSGFTGLCNLLPPLCASLSAAALLLYWRASYEAKPFRWKYLVLCMVAALLGMFSLSNGNLVWPLLVLAALALRRRLAAITLAAVAVAGICAFFYNYTVYITAASLSSAGEVVGLAKYIAVYFGSSWVTSNIRLAEGLGILGALLFMTVLWLMRSYFKTAPAMCVQFGVLLLFVLATGIVTAPGRVVFGLEGAFSGRYQSFALLFWGCIGVLLLGRWASMSSQKAVLLGAQAGLLAVMLFAASKSEALLARARWQGFNVNLAAVALETEAPDNAQLAWAHSQADYPRSLTPFLRDHRLSVFTDPEPYLIGRELSSTFTLANPQDCAGQAESTVALSNGWPRALRVSGWAWDVRDRRNPAAIIVASDGVISGLGVVGDRHAPMPAGGRPTGEFAGFTAYVRDVSRSSKVEIYAISRQHDTSVCHVATLNPDLAASR